MDKKKLIKIEKSKKGRGFNVLFECIECGKRKWINKSKWERGRGEGTYCSKECRIKSFKKMFSNDGNPNFKGGKIEVECYRCGKNF